ncbi:MAG: hypothetical protein ACI9XK_003278 [Granulosicoccus sp.]|jgi:uncharacterized protein YjiS (DUF1127 family)
MDAECLQEFSSEQSAGKGTRRKNRGFAHTINLWYERSRQRRELRELADSPDLLNDVGLSIYDVQQEARKPFWRE